MRNEILSERPNLFEPDAYIGFVVQLSGDISINKIMEAVSEAYEANETTMSKIVLDTEGKAFYEKMNKSGCTVAVATGNYLDIFTETPKKPFQLKSGELIRTFLFTEKENEKNITMLVMAHHLAGDGMAVCNFIEQILDILDGKEVSYRNANILTKEDLKQRGSLPIAMRLLVKRMNDKWMQTETVFTWQDYDALHKAYWKEHGRDIQISTLDSEEYYEMKNRAHDAGVTLNSLLVAELQKKEPKKHMLGIPVSVREKCLSMNNMTSGLHVKHKFDLTKSVEWNARQIQKKIQRPLRNKHLKYLAISFVAEVTGSLVDGVLMQKHGINRNKYADQMSKCMCYTGKNRTELGITNLGVIGIANQHDNFTVKDIIFIPPRVSYADEIVGIATFHDRVSIVRVNDKK